jgi:HSP20 family molecular chaperone IbpA
MTSKQLTLRDINRHFFGRDFDDFFSHPSLGSNYPLCNIVETEGGTRVEIALPGWTKEDVKVQVKQHILEIQGALRQKLKDAEKYVRQELSQKSFTRYFRLGDSVKVEKVYMKHGFLCIDLKEERKEDDIVEYEVQDESNN